MHHDGSAESAHLPSHILQVAREALHWDRPFKTVRSGSFEKGDIAWFPEGALNVSYNCVDRWAFKHPDKVPISHTYLGYLRD